MSRDSDISDNQLEEVPVDKQQMNKNIFVDRIARGLVNSHDIVDKRMLKLHKIVAHPSKGHN